MRRSLGWTEPALWNLFDLGFIDQESEPKYVAVQMNRKSREHERVKRIANASVSTSETHAGTGSVLDNFP